MNPEVKITYAWRLESKPSARMYVNDEQWLDPKPENTQFDLTTDVKKIDLLFNNMEPIYVGAFKGPVLDRVKR